MEEKKIVMEQEQRQAAKRRMLEWMQAGQNLANSCCG
jgi:hypothetical protein